MNFIIILLYTAFFSITSVLKYNSFSYNDFDLAAHVQTIWSIGHGSIYNSILGVPFIGDHANLIFFLIAPIYKLIPHPILLLLLQTLSLAVAGFFISRFAAQVLDKRWAIIFSLAYVLYPPLAYTNLYEFHATVFATLFLMLAFLSFYKNNFRFFILWAIMSMLCQENIPLIIAVFGICALLSKRSLKWKLFPLLAGALWFLAVVFVVKPRFGSETIQFYKLYAPLGDSLQAVLLNMLLHPIKMLKLISTKENLSLFVSLFGPLGFISLLNPSILIMAFPPLLQHMLSSRATEHTIYYHYAAEIIPFVFISAIFGIKFLKRLKTPEWLLMALVVAASLGFNIYRGPQLHLIKNFRLILKDDLDRYRDKLLKKVPRNAEVAATFQFLPHLANRTRLYSFHHVSTGFHTISTKPYKIPDDIEYALLDFDDPLLVKAFYSKESDIRILRFLKSRSWKISDAVNSIVLMQRKPDDSPSDISALCVRLEGPPENHAAPLAEIEGEIVFLGGDIGGITEKRLLTVSLFWKCINPSKKRYGIFIDIVDQKANIISRTSLPHCYRIYPTYRWKKDEVIKENYNILIPSKILKGEYKVVVGSWDERTDGTYHRTTIGKIRVK